MEEEKKESKEIMDNVKKETEEIIECILEEGIRKENVDFLYKVIDIHKDIANEEYWENKEEVMDMRYGNYGRGNYNESRYDDTGYGRSSYNESGSYGRRGRERDSRGRYREGRGSGRYRGEEMMDEMMYHYGNYNEGREQYGADDETMKSFKYMLKSFKDYYKHLKQEASSQQEVQMLEDVAREISEM